MLTVFLGHSSRDSVQAVALQTWLKRQREDHASPAGLTDCVHSALALRYPSGTGGCVTQSGAGAWA
jgi:hypothetical protein